MVYGQTFKASKSRAASFKKKGKASDFANTGIAAMALKMGQAGVRTGTRMTGKKP